MLKNKKQNSGNDPDYNLSAHEYADKHLLGGVADAIQNKCDAFVFVWLKKEPSKDKLHQHIYQGDTEDLLFLLDYTKAILLKEIIENER